MPGHRQAGVGTPGSLHKGDALLIHCSGVWLQQRKEVLDKIKTVNWAKKHKLNSISFTTIIILKNIIIPGRHKIVRGSVKTK